MRYPKFVAALGAALAGDRRGGRVGAGDAVELKVGDKAPDFSLVGSDGKTHKLSDLRGKTVVVAWFPKAFTGGCTTQCKALKESGEAIRAVRRGVLRGQRRRRRDEQEIRRVARTSTSQC